MSKLTAWVATIVGLVLLLPLFGVSQFGSISEGIIGWIFAVGILIIAIQKLVKNYSGK